MLAACRSNPPGLEPQAASMQTDAPMADDMMRRL